MPKDGQLFVLVLEARNVIAKDWGGSSDPYVKVYLDKIKVFKTPFLLKTLEPKWQEQARQLALSVDKPVTNLKFSVWDYDRFKWDEFLGEVRLEVEDLLDGVPRDEWYALVPRKNKSDKVTGELHVQIMFLEPGDQMTGNYAEFPYPLQTLMTKKKPQAFRNALDFGKDREVPDADGNRPLHVACLLNQPESVSLLLEKGANVKGLDRKDAQPIHLAASHSPNSIALLLAKGAQLNAADKEGRQPLHYAAIKNNATSVAVLIEKGADVNGVDSSGQTALHRALLERESWDAIRALVERGADIYLEDRSGKSCVDLCLDEKGNVTERTKKEFMNAVGVKDDREFLIRRDLKNVFYVEGKNLSHEWKVNDQFAISVPGDASVIKVLMHYVYEDKTAKQMEKTGFMVVTSDQGIHKEPSYQQDLLGYGTSEAFEIKVTKTPGEELFYILMPYAKTQDVKGYYDLILYSDGQLDINELVSWKHCQVVPGEWTADLSGGSRSDDVTWFNNPQFTLTAPTDPENPEARIDMTILLTQAKAQLDMIPYSLIAYQFYIGYYILDKEMFDVVVQCKKWKNAQETYLHFSISTAKEFVIIPTTHLPGQLTSFTMTVLSDVPVQLTRKK